MTLKTRQPTGRTGWPRILVEGGEKSGKSWALAELSASPKVGRTVVLVLGEDESKWDEFGQIEDVRFELALHDGSWTSIMGVLEDAKDAAAKALAAGEPPFVLGIDTVTAVWEGLKDWAGLRARNSEKNRKLLAQDPDAAIDVSSNYWNDSRRRWRQGLIRVALTFPGIVVMIARGREVTLFQNGQPVAGRKTWSVEGENNLVFDASVHVRLSREAKPLLISLANVKNGIMPGDPAEPMPKDWTLERLIFDRIKLDPANAVVPDLVEFRQDLTPEEVLAEAQKPDTTFARIRELYRHTDKAFPGVTLFANSNTEERLLVVLKRIGDERQAAEQARRPEPQPASGPHAREAHIALGGSPASAPPAGPADDAPAARKDMTAWAVALLDGIKSAVDGERADAEVDQERDAGRLSEDTAAGLHRAIAAKVADVISARADVTDKAAA